MLRLGDAQISPYQVRAVPPSSWIGWSEPPVPAIDGPDQQGHDEMRGMAADWLIAGRRLCRDGKASGRPLSTAEMSHSNSILCISAKSLTCSRIHSIAANAR